MDPNSERAARARTIFRAGNEALARAAASGDDAIPFICECSDEACLARVPLARAEYEDVRAHASRFIVALGHEGDAVTVARTNGYALVESDSALAVETDPRKGGGR